MRLKKLNENSDKLAETLRNILTDYGIKKTLLITGLNVFQLFDRMGDVIITPSDSYEILFHIFNNEKSL
jgi:hypothetical protein